MINQIELDALSIKLKFGQLVQFKQDLLMLSYVLSPNVVLDCQSFNIGAGIVWYFRANIPFLDHANRMILAKWVKEL